ncbi:pyrroloquinoline quinone biosynthesis protein D [[Luteovulum] sphaeroides subsp. megalophilum]|jgi:pyrroloquinoline quinone biosynthesis protein D|uniref:pyrroloquinoline quinone biosynthesis peptide chaperone PqqD n=1 Tax=Cereibacter sphaeroides TaxID=1063 RepID=UPI0000665598|nr:pyrroloquinoline quinone biosynthesis peptide chaperone PqqD [Cereibacter sphaeroides]ABN77549.1 coenzyme PQQ synthesis D [Cereibacter sphaeroides ATCC 17029]SNS55281.1 pyrroloquinoline quinone biosynthesis protein D [[Luteovulum] sphaeroides subsp. megalophilum]
MSRLELSPESVPQLARHARLRFDQNRQHWVLLVPERVMTPDEICVEILQACDGQATVAGLTALFERKYVAEPGVIAREVLALLQDLADRGYLIDREAA